MSDILHITNGDSAANLMRAGGIEGNILPWRDVLHEGPVPGGLNLPELSKVRAGFIADRGWGEYSGLVEEFTNRDRQLACFNEYQKVLLWFEHDLYDQLQILQILDYLGDKNLPVGSVGLICTEQYLGKQTPENIVELQQFEQPVAREHYDLAGRAWRAFRESTPEYWQGLLKINTDCLPFLHDAVLRVLEEFPDRITGLGRTEFQALTLLDQSPRPAGRLFGANQKLESRIYLGDWSFWHLLNGMMDCAAPLLEFEPGNTKALKISLDDSSISVPLQITALGKEVLVGNSNYLDLDWMPRWIGGVKLNSENRWCWNRESGMATFIQNHINRS